METHAKHLAKVLKILRTNKLCEKSSKCTFSQSQLEYLGHIISDKGVATDSKKTIAMANWPTPTNLIELRGILGLTGYYRKYIRGYYGIIAKLLTDLLKKKAFKWTPEAQEAFEALKQAMMSTLVLVLPDFSQPFCIETDACHS